MASFPRVASTVLVLAGILTFATFARADGPDGLTRLRETLKREPRAPDVVRMALDYYRCSPETMEALRSSSRYRGLMPVVSGFAGYGAAGSASAQAQTITNPQNVVVNNAGSNTVFTGGIAWDLRDLIFNPAEIQTYAVLPIQRDITLEVVRTYFLRRQLQIRLAMSAPKDPLALATLELRVEEYSAILNAMTGGSFQRVATAGQQ